MGVHVWRPLPTSTWARRRSLLTLAIESSCDDTCVSILSKRSIYSEPNFTKAHLHFNEKITLHLKNGAWIVTVRTEAFWGFLVGLGRTASVCNGRNDHLVLVAKTLSSHDD